MRSFKLVSRCLTVGAVRVCSASAIHIQMCQMIFVRTCHMGKSDAVNRYIKEVYFLYLAEKYYHTISGYENYLSFI
jgi:hypothetical protein